MTPLRPGVWFGVNVWFGVKWDGDIRGNISFKYRMLPSQQK
jgi:hypothetical protein